jgi:CubicO group peptidase (beta-lactamase class C family)
MTTNIGIRDLNRRTTLALFFLTGGMLPACSGSPASGGSGDPPIPAKYASFAAAFDQERQQLGVSGASVALIENGEVTFAHGFGTKGPNSHEPVDANTLFRIGSMTKALTATALLGSVDSGTVSLDATLTSVVPDVAISDPGNLGALTLRQLLSQQSGLYDYFVLQAPTDDAALSQFLTSPEYAANEYFMDPPGTFYNYANPNFSLAGLALERASGISYRQAVADRVLAPLGMQRTFFLPSEVIADGNFSDGASTDDTGGAWDVAPDAYDNAWLRPAGYAFSSVVDFAKFVQFLYAGNASVLTDADRAAMQTPQVDTRDYGDVEGYGFALIIDQGFNLGSSWFDTKLVSHGGDIPGFAADFFLVPSTGFGIVSFASADDAHFQSSLLLAMQSFANLQAPGSRPTNVAVDPSTFASIAGTYEDSYNVGEVTIGATASGLTIAMPAVDAANIPYDKTLQPVTADNFSLSIEGTPIDVTFFRGSSGAYEWMRTRPFVAQRFAPDGGAPSDAGSDGGDGGDGGAAIRRFDADAFRERLKRAALR